jgi:hypothetical protein
MVLGRVALLAAAVVLVLAPVAAADADGSTSMMEPCVYTGVHPPEVAVTPQTCVVIVKSLLHDVHQLVGTGGGLA